MKVLLVILPVVLAGIVHSAVIRGNWLPSLAQPLDFGAQLGGRPLLGANKTFRGPLVMLAGSALAAWALSLALNAAGMAECALHPALPCAPLAAARWLPHGFEFMLAPERAAMLGALMGLGYALGELPNSFIKRWLGIAPGGNPGGVAGFLCYLADQVDSVLGVTVLLGCFYAPPAEVLLALLALGSLIHIVFDYCLYLTGVKHRALPAQQLAEPVWSSDTHRMPAAQPGPRR